MTPPTPEFGSFGGHWSDVKLSAVKAYFTAFNQALSKTSFTRVYIDAFAGGGRVRSPVAKKSSPEGSIEGDWFDSGEDQLGLSDPNDPHGLESEVLRHGSPLLALEASPEFHEFIFIERNPATLKLLEEQVKGSPALRGRPVEFICDDANAALSRICRPDWKKTRRATVFLDPFALHIRWTTLEAIARTEGMDMWMLFPAMAVNRMLPRSAEVPEVWAKRLDDTFGDSSWREEFFAAPEVLPDNDFFPEHLENRKEAKLDDPFGRLSRYVTRRLKTVFADAVEEPLLLKTAGRAPLFLLCFAVANERGAPIAKRIAAYIIKSQKHGN
jgi:three-Cys-motif partner protein